MLSVAARLLSRASVIRWTFRFMPGIVAGRGGRVQPSPDAVGNLEPGAHGTMHHHEIGGSAARPSAKAVDCAPSAVGRLHSRCGRPGGTRRSRRGRDHRGGNPRLLHRGSLCPRPSPSAGPGNARHAGGSGLQPDPHGRRFPGPPGGPGFHHAAYRAGSSYRCMPSSR